MTSKCLYLIFRDLIRLLDEKNCWTQLILGKSYGSVNFEKPMPYPEAVRSYCIEYGISSFLTSVNDQVKAHPNLPPIPNFHLNGEN